MDEETTNDQNVTEPFKCNCCGKTFLRPSWLVRHGFSHPELNKDEYPCFHCNNLYQGKFAKGSYKKHIDRLITREERICQTCGHMARTVEFLEVHKQVEHFRLKRFKCNIEDCDKVFLKTDYLRRHKKGHDTNNSYPCDQCKFSSNMKENISKHKRRHHVVWNLNCEECAYIGPSKESLQIHKQSYHSGIINECIPCNKKYRNFR